MARTRRPQYEDAPEWVGTGKQGGARPELVLMQLDEGPMEVWTVLTREEALAIGDEDSYLGGLLRPHCAVAKLEHMDYN